jgi:hypothetical protein
VRLALTTADVTINFIADARPTDAPSLGYDVVWAKKVALAGVQAEESVWKLPSTIPDAGYRFIEINIDGNHLFYAFFDHKEETCNAIITTEEVASTFEFF